MKQIDIFGNETDIADIQYNENSKKGAIPIKIKFRNAYGYKDGYYCKNCKHFGVIYHNLKNYYKCEKIGISSSSATDIRVKDTACRLYEEEKI